MRDDSDAMDILKQIRAEVMLENGPNGSGKIGINKNKERLSAQTSKIPKL